MGKIRPRTSLTRSRLGVASVLGVLVALVSFALPTLAYGATTHTVTHRGTYHISGGLFNANQVKTPAYGTRQRARTCVQFIGRTHSGGRYNRSELKLIWYDGGKNVVLSDMFVYSPGTYCSPWEGLPNTGPKVYDFISTGPGDSIHGNWYIYVNV